MNKKQILLYGLAAVLLAILVYIQFRTWRNFDWDKFLSQLDNIRWLHIFHAVALIYLAYVMRAIRWKIFLRPVRRNASSIRLIALRIREFRSGLDTIHSPSSFFSATAVSIVMWCVIAVAYKEVTHAYGADELEIPQTQVLLLMGSSMVGSIIQLPGVGGGSQLATIAALEHIFDVPKELAASCGIMLWLVTFVAVVPLGLFLAHRERLSLRQLSQESHVAEQSGADPSAPAASS